jgi:hypothetical protein
MRILALDGSLARASAALWVDGAVLARRALAGDRGQPTALPPMAEELLRDGGALDAVAVVVGPARSRPQPRAAPLVRRSRIRCAHQWATSGPMPFIRRARAAAEARAVAVADRLHAGLSKGYAQPVA